MKKLLLGGAAVVVFLLLVIDLSKTRVPTTPNFQLEKKFEAEPQNPKQPRCTYANSKFISNGKMKVRDALLIKSEVTQSQLKVDVNLDNQVDQGIWETTFFFQGVRIRQTEQDLCQTVICPLRAGRHLLFTDVDSSLTMFPEKVSKNAIEKAHSKLDQFYERTSDVDGNMTHQDALVLGSQLLDVFSQVALPASVVHIGAQTGKMSVFSATMLRIVHPAIKVIVFDTNQQQQARSISDTVKASGLTETVTVLTTRPEEFKWEDNTPIGFLYIEGGNSYQQIASYWYHFAKYLAHGAVVAFDGYNGGSLETQRFVNELLENNNEWRNAGSSGTVIFVQKEHPSPGTEHDFMQARTCLKDVNGRRHFCVTSTIPMPDPDDE